MSHVTHEWVMSHMNESCRIFHRAIFGILFWRQQIAFETDQGNTQERQARIGKLKLVQACTMHVCMKLYVLCMYVYTYISMHICMYERTYVCIHVCTWQAQISLDAHSVNLYVCMYVYICRHAFTHTNTHKHKHTHTHTHLHT